MQTDNSKQLEKTIFVHRGFIFSICFNNCVFFWTVFLIMRDFQDILTSTVNNWFKYAPGCCTTSRLIAYWTLQIIVLGCAFELNDNSEIDTLRFSINKAEVALKQVRRSQKDNEHSKLFFLFHQTRTSLSNNNLRFSPAQPSLALNVFELTE